MAGTALAFSSHAGHVRARQRVRDTGKPCSGSVARARHRSVPVPGACPRAVADDRRRSSADVDPAHVLSSVTDSRYYYLALAGFLLCAAGIATRLRPSRARRHRILPIMAVAALVLAFAATSQRLARKWRFDTTPLRVLVEQANRAIAKLPLPQATCQIYLLGTRDVIFAQYADDTIKATYPDIDQVADCLVQTDHTPWHHLIPVDSATQRDFAPMTALVAHNRKVTWPRVGNVDIAYLNLPDEPAPTGMTNAWFLLWQGGRFTDISADVNSGRTPVEFHCNRPGDQCR